LVVVCIDIIFVLVMTCDDSTLYTLPIIEMNNWR